MLEAVQLIWRYRRYALYAVLSVIIIWQYAVNSGLRADLATEKLKSTQLSASVEQQNKQVMEMAALAAKRQKEAEAALKAAEATANGHSSKATKILMAQPKSNDECVAALELLKEYQK